MEIDIFTDVCFAIANENNISIGGLLKRTACRNNICADGFLKQPPVKITLALAGWLTKPSVLMLSELPV